MANLASLKLSKNSEALIETISLKKVSYLLIDADDTLWLDAVYFQTLQDQFISLFESDGGRQTEAEQLLQIELEKKSPGEYGFIECIKGVLTTMGVSQSYFVKFDRLVWEFNSRTIQLVSGVGEFLRLIREDSPQFKLICMTKGIATEQNQKLIDSGLHSKFDEIQIMSRKTIDEYRAYFTRNGLLPSKVLMIGNSIKHDISPVVSLGGQAIWMNHSLNLNGNNHTLPHDVPSVTNFKPITEYFKAHCTIT